jgi:hypothetical protein
LSNSTNNCLYTIIKIAESAPAAFGIAGRDWERLTKWSAPTFVDSQRYRCRA